MNDEANRYTALKLWKEKSIEKGTYFELILVLLENENFQLANEVVSLLDLELTPQLVTEVFKGFLRSTIIYCSHLPFPVSLMKFQFKYMQ